MSQINPLNPGFCDHSRFYLELPQQFFSKFSKAMFLTSKVKFNNFLAGTPAYRVMTIAVNRDFGSIRLLRKANFPASRVQRVKNKTTIV